MSVLTVTQLAECRNRLEGASIAITYTKPQINVALQAIEDAMTTQTIPAIATGLTVPAYLSGRIDTATTPLVLTAAQKKAAFALWARLKFIGDL